MSESTAEANFAAPITYSLQGEKVALGPLRRELNPLYQRWNNDPLVNRTTASFRPVTLEEQVEGFEQFIKDKRYVLFTIYERATARPIGMTYLAGIDERNRTAEFGIVIGEGDCQGRGLGTEATRLVLDYAFQALGLHNVFLTVYAYNLRGLRAYEKAGFRIFGRRHEARQHMGRLWDVIYMECLASEFESPVLRRLWDAGQEERTDAVR